MVQAAFNLAANSYCSEEPQCDHGLLQQFRAQFAVLTADTPERIRTAQQVRHQVYCVEHAHEKPQNDDRIEADEFDAHAAHSLLIHRSSHAAVGTVRLILPRTNELNHSFAVQRVMGESALMMFNQLPLASTAEVSRFSISRQLRNMAVPSQSGPLMRLGLIQALVRMSREHGITHWCAAMEPTLLRMLSAMAIRFRPIGPLIEYHGLRQPAYCVLSDVLNAVRHERPTFWSILTDGGALTD
jgi:N-acyl-L-homoserine lactone synthetase